MHWRLPDGAALQLTFFGASPVPTPAQLDAIIAYLALWTGGVPSFLQEIRNMSANLDQIRASIDALQADVAAQTTVTASALALIGGLRDQLAEALAADLALPELTARLETINAALDKERESLAAALVVNTPADPTPAPVVDPVDAPTE